MSVAGRSSVVALLALFASACATGPGQVHWGEEACAHCQMAISDERYAAQVVDSRGKTWKFDSLECMAAFLAGADMTGYSAWVADGRAAWIPADRASIVRSEQIRSPMGGGLAAFRDAEMARAAAREVGGTMVEWQTVLSEAVSAQDGNRGY